MNQTMFNHPNSKIRVVDKEYTSQIVSDSGPLSEANVTGPKSPEKPSLKTGSTNSYYILPIYKLPLTPLPTITSPTTI